MASATSTIEATPDSKRRANFAMTKLMQILESKLGNAEMYGETILKIRWRQGQIEHVQVMGVEDFK